MTEDNKLNDLQTAVELALQEPVPEQNPDRVPYLFEKVRFGFNRNLKPNQFPLGKSDKPKFIPKLDASGEPVKLPNGGAVMVKDLSGIKFWHEGKLISKAEHDELTNGVGK